MGILINTGFDLGSSSPIDSRTVKNTIGERDALISDGLVYENLKVYCKDTQKEYRWTGTEWEEVGTGGAVDPSGYATTYTSLAELGLTADATIDDVINALKDGETALINTNEFTNYLTMFPNQCANDQYAVIKVERKNGNICFIEWRQKEGNAYAIGGLDGSNKFTNWNNVTRFKKDGFADDSIVCIGDTVSADGVMQTLDSLGFSKDILTWDTGVYRVSDVSELTNLPSGVINAEPAFRLEHHNIKKWTSNHNPNTKTWAQRHSVIYCDNCEVYQRFYESGNTAGTYIRDTGWQKIVTQKDLDDLFQSVSNGKSLVANAITGKGVSTATDATFATMATNISKISASSYKEETKSYTTTSSGTPSMTFTFSADVIGIKQIILPTDSSRLMPQSTLESFKIEGKNVTMNVLTGVGTWKITALIKA